MDFNLAYFSPPWPEDKLKEPPETTENTHEQEMREKIRKEYKTAQTHEGTYINTNSIIHLQHLCLSFIVQ